MCVTNFSITKYLISKINTKPSTTIFFVRITVGTLFGGLGFTYIAVKTGKLVGY